MNRLCRALACLAALCFAALPAAAEPISVLRLMAPTALPDMALGQPTAPVTVVEYASMTCSHCAAFNRTVMDTLKSAYIDTGKVHYVLREYPLDQLSFAAFAAARCAPPDKYFAIVDALFLKQDTWAFVDKPVPALIAELQPFGFTGDSFAACLDKSEIINGISEIAERAQKEFGVDGTPTFFINGEKHVGELDLAGMQALLDPLLAPK
jgi:protein-disulfide isomerase